MENILKKALDQVRADEGLKKRTAAYVLNTESAVVPIKTHQKKPLYVKRLAVTACAAVVLCALPIGAYAYYETPTSYVSVDINPSVELGVNAFGKVVSAKAYNTDGETVIAGLPLLHSNVESAVRQIVQSASQNGFIKDDGSTYISVTAETNNEKKAEKLNQDAQAGAEEAIEAENDSATVETDKIALARRDEAINLGITPGKLNLIQKLQALDPTIKTEEYKDVSVTEIQKKFIELKKEHKGNNVSDEAQASVPPDPSENPAVSPSPNVSPSASPAPESAKPGNGKHGGNGNGKKDVTDSSTPGIVPESSPSETPAFNGKPDQQNEEKESSGNSDHNSDKENNGNTGNNGNSGHAGGNGKSPG